MAKRKSTVQFPDVDILSPGNAGSLDDDEHAYLVGHLRGEPALRLAWGLGSAPRVTFPRWLVQAVAMYGDGERESCNRRLVVLARWSRRQVGPSPDAVLAFLSPIVANAADLPRPEDVSGYHKRPVSAERLMVLAAAREKASARSTKPLAMEPTGGKPPAVAVG